MEKKIRKTIRINPQVDTELVAYAARTGETETLIVEQALQRFFADQSQEYERIADTFLKKFDEKYKNYMTRVRLASRGADVNSQVIIETLNTGVLWEDTQSLKNQAAYERLREEQEHSKTG